MLLKTEASKRERPESIRLKTSKGPHAENQVGSLLHARRSTHPVILLQSGTAQYCASFTGYHLTSNRTSRPADRAGPWPGGGGRRAGVD